MTTHDEYADSSPEDRLGQTIGGRWHLEALIGEGGMAAVYRARHSNGRQVALKILNHQLSASDHARDRFLAEGHAANRVGHPGTVAVYDDGIDESGCAYLVMELLSGSTLEQLSGKVGLDEILRIAGDTCDVLDCAHRQGIIHRDIKPDNVFVTDDGQVKLLDFGIARMADAVNKNRTQAGVLMGTPAFMSPEQARGRWEILDARADIFGLGATLYSMIAGRPPRVADTINEILLAAMTQPVEPLRRHAPQTPSSLAAVIDRAVARLPENRFDSIADMAAALRGCDPYEAGGREVEPATWHDRETDLTLADSPSSFQPVMGAAEDREEKRFSLPLLSIAAFVTLALLLLTWVPSVMAPDPSPSLVGTPAELKVESDAHENVALDGTAPVDGDAPVDRTESAQPRSENEREATSNETVLDLDHTLQGSSPETKTESAQAEVSSPAPSVSRASTLPVVRKEDAQQDTVSTVSQPSIRKPSPSKPKNQPGRNAPQSSPEPFDPLSLRR